MTRFYLASLLALTGGHLVNYIVILYLQEKVGSELLSGIGYGLSFGSSVVFGWFAGVVADRHAPIRVTLWAQSLFFVSLFFLLAAELWATDETRVATVLLGAFFSGLAWSFSGPARFAALGQLVPAERLKPATITFNLQVMLGLGLAPIVLAVARSLGGWLAVFAVAASLFALSALCFLGYATQPAASRGKGVMAEVGESLRVIAGKPLLRELLLLAMLVLALTGPMQIGLPRIARDVLELGEVERGLYMGLIALSLIGGGMLALVLGRRISHGPGALAGSVVACLSLFMLGQFTSVAGSTLSLLGCGGAAGVAISLVVADIQAQAPVAMRGRIMAVYSITSQVVPALSGVLAGVLVRSWGAPNGVSVSGAGLALLALACVWALRHVRALRH